MPLEINEINRKEDLATPVTDQINFGSPNFVPSQNQNQENNNIYMNEEISQRSVDGIPIITDPTNMQPVPAPIQGQVTNINMPQIPKTKTAFLGFGGAGVNVIKSLVKNITANNTNNLTAFESLQFVAINSDNATLNDLDQNIKFVEFGTGLGSGMDENVGKADFEGEGGSEGKAQKTLETLVKDCALIFAIVGTTGGAGVGSLLAYLEKMKDRTGVTIVIIALFPFEFEGTRKYKTALSQKTKLESISQKYNYDFISNKKIYDLVITEKDADYTEEEMLKIGDDAIIKIMMSVIRIITTRGQKNIDFADIRRVLSGGRCLILKGIGKTLIEAVSNAILLNKIHEEQELLGFDSILMYVSSKESATMKDITESFKILQNGEENHLLKNGWNKTDSDTFEVDILLAGRTQNQEVESDLSKSISSIIAKPSAPQTN